MHRVLPLILLALAACATPQEACINRETRELRTLDGLIAEQRATLARGYALAERTAWRLDWRICDPGAPATDTMPARPPRWCWDQVPVTVTDRVPIDPAAEARKLAGLEARRAEEAALAQTRVSQCRALYPE